MSLRPRRAAALAALALALDASTAAAQNPPRVRVELPPPTTTSPAPDPSDRRTDEARALEAQARTMAVADPHRVAILFRLAEIYAALSSRAREAQRNADAADLRGRAIGALATLVRDFPNDGRADEALALLGYQQNDAGDAERARGSYRELMRRFPQSRFVPQALVALGDGAFEQGDMAGARPLYERAAALDPGSNPMRAYALYKLGWVAYNTSDYAGSVARFSECVAEARAHPGLGINAALLRQAPNEEVPAYAALLASGRFVPADVLRALTGDAGDEARGVELFARLAEAFADNGQYDRARAAYEHLLATHASAPRAAEWRDELARLPAPR